MKHLIKFIAFILLGVTFQGCSPKITPNSILITGATLINPGNPPEIIKNSYLYIENGKIISYGEAGTQPKTYYPEKKILANGKFIMPGLIDGFATLNNQAYANAYLYKGITTLLEVDGYRRGPFFLNANPSPNIFRLEGVGEEPTTNKEIINKLDSLQQAGYKVALLMYGLTPSQLKLVNDYAKKLGMATIGELATTTYKQAMDIGVDAFVHTTRYSLDVAPKHMREGVAKEPFSNDLNSAKWTYYKYLTTLKKGDSALATHAKNLANSNTYIIPTLSLSYLDLPEAKNPWLDPVAKILNPKDINRPADLKTGKHTIDATEQAAYTKLITTETTVIEPTYYKAGAKYLAGSGTDVWGTMPGISLHTELELLHQKVGLKIEEVLAAATVNFNKAFGWKVGKIAPEFKADLLILTKNPLDDLKNLNSIESIILNGKEINPQSLLKN